VAEEPLSVEFERRAMGSRLRLHVVGEPGGRPTDVQRAWERVSEDVETSESALSRFRHDSDLVALNRHAGTGVAVSVSRRLCQALSAAERARRATEGLFDVRVLGDLERLGYGPGSDETAAGTSGGGWSIAPVDGLGGDTRRQAGWLKRDPVAGTVSLAEPVDLGGIGKGLALRWAARLLTDRAGRLPPTWRAAILEAGGDLVLLGRPPAGERWPIGIEDPFDASRPAAVLGVPSGAVCTSATTVNTWRMPDGREVHHLIDPRTGEPGGDGIVSVTVAWADPAWAEVWSKALFLAGPREIGPLARRHGLAAWWIDRERTLSMTPAGREATLWTADSHPGPARVLRA
jgi:thiamine biosynthesis lipoprotein